MRCQGPKVQLMQRKARDFFFILFHHPLVASNVFCVRLPHVPGLHKIYHTISCERCCVMYLAQLPVALAEKKAEAPRRDLNCLAYVLF